MRMNGSWHIYRPGEKWQRPARAMRILIATAEWVAVAFNVYVAEFVRRRRLAAPADRHAGSGSARRVRSGSSAFGRSDAQGDARSARGAARSTRRGRHRQRLQVRNHVPVPAPSRHAGTTRSTRRQWRACSSLAQRLLRANVAESAGSGHRDLPRLATHDRAHEPGGSIVGLQPRRPALPQVRHAYREPQGRRRCAGHLLVPAVPSWSGWGGWGGCERCRGARGCVGLRGAGESG